MCTEICTFKMKQNKVSQEGVLSLSLFFSTLSLSLSLHEQTSNAASNQTQDKQFIKKGGHAIIHRIAPLNLRHDAEEITRQTNKAVSSKATPGLKNFLDISQSI